MIWLVTGAAGYVGGHVVRAMLRADHGVVAYDDLSTGDPAVLPAGVPLVRGCVTDARALRRAMAEHRVDGVIHLAARKSVGESVADPVGYFRQNVDGTLAVVEAMLAAGVRRVVLASSAAVYGSPDPDAVTEDSPTRPVNPYGETKLASEWIIRDAGAAYGLEHACLRYFNVAGCAAAGLRDRGASGLIPRALGAVLEGRDPVVLGRDYPTPDGTCVRDFVHVADVASAHVMVARALERGWCGPVYTVGSGMGRSVLDVLDTIRRVTGAAFTVEAEARRPGDPAHVVAGIGRIRAEIGWAPRYSLAEMVRDEWRARLAVAGPMTRRAARPAPAGAAGGRPSRGRVVLVTASVGAGHDGAAREWAGRLAEQGFDTDTHDFLALLPGLMRRGVRDWYHAMLHRAPWSYSLVFWLAAVPGCRALIGSLLAPFRGRMRRLVPADAVAVLSTYPLASQLLGQLRRRGRLAVPVATFLTDFSVHRLWVAPGVDAHYALHRVAAEQAEAYGAAGVTVTGPLVGAAFGPGTAAARRRARRRFGLPEGQRLALLVAGSWGVGRVERTAAEIARTGVAVPVVVCGRNEALRERLGALGAGHPVGWVEDMPELMRAVDVLVENAGGLTSLEAMASGLPVATYRPIPGHGRTNAAALDQAGVSSWIRDEGRLAAALTELMDGPRGRQQRNAARALFDAAPTRPLVETALGEAPAPGRRAWRGRWMRWAAAAAVVLVLLNATVGTRLAVAHGLDSLRPGTRDAAFLVVHPSPHAQLDAATIRLLAGVHAGIAVDDALIMAQPDAVRRLAAAGLTLVNAGSGPPYETGIVGGRSVIARDASAIRRLTGSRPPFYLAGPDVDAVDVGTVSYLGEDIVQPRMRISGAGPAPWLPRGKIVLVECATRPPCDLARTLTVLRNQAAAQPMRLGSLTELDP